MRFGVAAIWCLLVFKTSAQTFTINFENSKHLDTSLLKIDSASCWVVGSPNKTYLSGSYSIPNAIITDTINPYPVLCNSSFVLTRPSDSCHYIEFKLKYDCEPCRDGLVIEITTDTLDNWVNLFEHPNFDALGYLGHEFHFPADTCTLYNGETGITGTGEQILYLVLDWNTVRAGIWGPNWRIRFRFVSDSVDSGHEGVLLDDFEINPYICVGSAPENSSENFEIYPNPAGDFLHFSNINSFVETITIYNGSGQFVKQCALSQNRIEISDLDKGFYIIAGTIHGQGLVNSFIKQ